MKLFDNVNKKQTIYILLFIMVVSAIFGFIYEEIFYYFDLGYLVKRGTTYGPWIPIYAFGGFLIVLLTYRFKDKPILVFITNILLTGIIEYFTGYFLDKMGIRLWDYNNEILNFGNINGYVCLRSVLFFGISSLLLIYVIVPIVLKVYKKIGNKFNLISIILSSLFIIDFILYRIFN